MLSEKEIDQYNEQGFLIIENFLTNEEIEILKEECHQTVERMDIHENPSIIISGDKQIGDDYFITSGDKIRFFFEEKACNKSGKVIIDKTKALDKIGHALHWWLPNFKAVTFSDRIKAIAKSLTFTDPVVVQSMYIFKHPDVGGEVKPHQDATYLHTEPQSCVGFWFALEDVTLENGCLHFIPGSQKGPLVRRMIRNPMKTGPMLLHTAPNKDYNENDFIPVPVKKGSLVLIHGLVVHKSGINTTKASREIYTFHIIEKFQTKYSRDNWLQPTEDLPFPSLYETVL